MHVNSEDRCPNCSAELNGPFCSSCGQRQIDLDKPLREIGSEAMDAFLSFDARILRTLWPLIARPGFLTVEFLEGRRARYVHPFKLYFAFSVLLFVGLAISRYSVVVIGDSGNVVITTGSAGSRTEASDPDDPGDEASEPPPKPTETVDGNLATDTEDDAVDSVVGRMLAPLGELAESDPGRLNRIFTDRLAKSIIVLVPVFALLLRALYWRRTYITQLVFSLHLHSFSFFALLVGIGVDRMLQSPDRQGPGNAISVVAIAVYTFLALRRVQRQGRIVTGIKIFVLMIGYIISLIFTMILTLAVTALSI